MCKHPFLKTLQNLETTINFLTDIFFLCMNVCLLSAEKGSLGEIVAVLWFVCDNLRDLRENRPLNLMQ